MLTRLLDWFDRITRRTSVDAIYHDLRRVEAEALAREQSQHEPDPCKCPERDTPALGAGPNPPPNSE